MPSAVATKVCVVDTGVQYDHPDLVASMDPTYGKGFNAITGLFDAMDDNGRIFFLHFTRATKNTTAK